MNIRILEEKCNGCGVCADACPFSAISVDGGVAVIGASCRLCRLCVKTCPQEAIALGAPQKHKADKEDWNGVLVIAEQNNGKLHPVTFELLGEAAKLAGQIRQPVGCLVMGREVGVSAEELLHYGADEVYVCESEDLEHFRADAYTDAAASCLETIKPCAVLVGATAAGRSLAPRLSARLRTGLTADCTELQIKENSDLVQIRPAFGGNIMARIVTPNTRPQFATVRYKVMRAAERSGEARGKITRLWPPEISSGIRVLEAGKLERGLDISECDVLVAAGRGVRDPRDLVMLEELAALLGGQLACTRPLVENGWLSYTRQIGLSGRTVKPRLIIACGVSGAVQFTAAMDGSERIIAVNKDPEAGIFRVAHYAVVGDIYEVVPRLIRLAQGGAV